jgi:hypothetical protein
MLWLFRININYLKPMGYASGKTNLMANNCIKILFLRSE